MSASHAEHLDHRSGLTRHASDLLPPTGLLGDLGGPPGIRSLVACFYQRVEADPELRPMFVHDLTSERDKLAMFLVEWLGGPAEYSRDHHRLEVRERHRHIWITARAAGRWLGHMKGALQESDVPPEVARRWLSFLGPLARAHTNQRDSPPAQRQLRCQAHKSLQRLSEAARRGRLGDLEAAFADAPLLLDHPSPDRHRLLVSAARGGRLEVVEWLLERGAPLDAPAHLGNAHLGGVPMTPWCAARAHRKPAVAKALAARGACHDVFSAATLGDEARLRELAARDVAILDLEDPVTDFACRRPIDYAAARGRWGTVNLLLDLGASEGRDARGLLRAAADRGDLDTCRRLLEFRPDVSSIGAGDWVLHEEVAALLLDHGADVNFAPTLFRSWHWRVCSGNHGARDRPELVRRLLACGADVHARQRGRTPLHYAAKAGFVETCRILLGHGADPGAEDAEGATPRDMVADAGKRVDRAAIRRVLDHA